MNAVKLTNIATGFKVVNITTAQYNGHPKFQNFGPALKRIQVFLRGLAITCGTNMDDLAMWSGTSSGDYICII